MVALEGKKRAQAIAGVEDEEEQSQSQSQMSSEQKTTSTESQWWATSRYGVSYSPYRGDGNCKSQEELNNDFDRISLAYNLVRIYGVDCNQIALVKASVERRKQQHPLKRQQQQEQKQEQEQGEGEGEDQFRTAPPHPNGDMRMFAGIFDLSNLPNDVNTIIQTAAGDWSDFDTISIGNELVNDGKNTPAEVVNAVNTARTTLRAAGYQGPVVTVDTFNQMIDHPELCQASDYCAANCHAFFDNAQSAANAGKYVREQADKITAAANGNGNNQGQDRGGADDRNSFKRTVITESGWPYAGQSNGAAVPSRQNQRAAILSLMHEFPEGDLILFSAFDDKWKTDNAGTFGTEKYWGFMHDPKNS
jgi:exo-beta-1,3-glucanase (GH17 family)